MDEQEIKNFLSSVKLNVHLGTVDEKGDANIHPTWFYYDPSKEMIYVETSKQAKKTVNLRKGGKIYFCIDDSNPPYKGVRGKGSVRIYEDVEFNLPIWYKGSVKPDLI